MQPLGQHFLKDAATLKKIAAGLALQDGDAVIEIGPGHGELTDFLLAGVGAGGSVTVIEKDARLVAHLKERFAGKNNLEIIEGDALEMLPGMKLQEKKLAGNLPYYITGYLLREIGEADEKPERCVFMVQKEVAERMAAEPPKMNRLAASVQFWGRPKILCVVPKERFSPKPKIDSAVILLETKARPDIGKDQYYQAVRAIFAQPRKTILNNLMASAMFEGDGAKKEKIVTFLASAGIVPEARPQNLDIKEITALAGAFGDR